MKKGIKNLPASIHGRLNRLAKETNRSFQEVFHYYAMERFLYRLSQSQYCSDFILKGGLAFFGWGIPLRRSTRDIDFQANVDNSVEEMVSIIKNVCSIRKEDEDGIVFEEASVTGVTIMEGAEYQGVRIRFKGYLEKAYVWLQIDTSFSNVITPKEVSIEYPTILNMPGFELKSYNPETAIAEKLQAMIFLGSFNDRMKDFYDIYLLSQERDFDGPVFVRAITATFKNRKTEIPLDIPKPLSDDFASQKQASWHQFMSGVIIDGIEVKSFNEVIEILRKFILPPIHAAAKRKQFNFEWRAGKTWEKKIGYF
jgi:predicted nucleotidyltransferase component of viral defense system